MQCVNKSQIGPEGEGIEATEKVGVRIRMVRRNLHSTWCDGRHGPTFLIRRHFDCQHWFRERVRKFSSSRLSRGSSGKGKPRLASFVQGSPVAARYRPPASATGPRYYLVSYKRLRSDGFLRGRFILSEIAQ